MLEVVEDVCVAIGGCVVVWVAVGIVDAAGRGEEKEPCRRKV